MAAHMIHMMTGKWPKIDSASPSTNNWQDEDWYTYLPKAGYGKFVSFIESGNHYVGIGGRNEEFGNKGIIVWFEKVDQDNKRVVVSSYLDRKYWIGSIKPEEFVWVQID